MKHLRKFNESKSLYDYEIVDYFLGLEDDGILEIDKVQESLPTSGNVRVSVNHIEYVVNNCLSAKKSHPRYIIEKSLEKYLNYFSIKSSEEFFRFKESADYIPLMSLILTVESEIDTNSKRVYEIKDIIESCEGLSKTKVFGCETAITRRVIIYFIEIK